MLTKQQQAEADALIDILLDLSGSKRWEHWRNLTVPDPAVRSEVESFLRSADSLGDFLCNPVRSPLDEPGEDLTVGVYDVRHH